MQWYRFVLFLLLMGLLSACGDTGSSLTTTTPLAVSATQQVQKFNATASSQEQVQKAFIAYYGRPADPSGLSYWATQLDTAGGNWSAIIESFGNSSEATALLAGLTNEQKIDKLYTQMFGRNADSGGRTYYANGLSNGSFTLASLAINIINGTTGSDATTIANKLYSSQLFTASLNNSNSSSYNSNSVIAVRIFLAGITITAATQASIDAVLTSANIPLAPRNGFTVGGLSGKSFMVVDNGSITFGPNGSLSGPASRNGTIIWSINSEGQLVLYGTSNGTGILTLLSGDTTLGFSCVGQFSNGTSHTFEFTPLSVTNTVVVTDPATNLMWQQADDNVKRNWTNAIAYCDGLNLGGYSDWRLPSRSELRSLNYSSVINQISGTYYAEVGTQYIGSYWSSTSLDNSQAYHVFLMPGSTSEGYANKSYYNNLVRCVRP